MTAQLSLTFTEQERLPVTTKDAGKAVVRPSNRHLGTTLGTGVSKCYGCGEVFNSVSAFDAHQRLDKGQVICLHPLDLTDKDGNPKPMAFNRHGLWVTELRDPGAFAGDGGKES